MSRKPTDILVESHWEDSDIAIMARIKGANGSNINQATLSSISAYVYNATTQVQVGTTLTLTISSVIFDTLQTGSGWSEDSTGFNFRYVIDGDYFPSGNTPYRVEIIFTPVNGSPFPVVVELDTQHLWSS